jgi:hypothetical protein
MDDSSNISTVIHRVIFKAIDQCAEYYGQCHLINPTCEIINTIETNLKINENESVCHFTWAGWGDPNGCADQRKSCQSIFSRFGTLESLVGDESAGAQLLDDFRQGNGEEEAGGSEALSPGLVRFLITPVGCCSSPRVGNGSTRQ